MKILAHTLHGSHLYRLNNEKSDIDYKQIFLPKIKDCLLFKPINNLVDHNKNIDFEQISFQKFLKDLSTSQDYAITMLHCSNSDILQSSETFEYLRDNRHIFYIKKMTGMLNFSRSQAAKYALRADRMNAVKKFIDILKDAESKGVARISQIYDDLPEGEYYYKGIEERNNTVDKRFFECAGKRVTATVAITYALEIFENLYNSYGDRVKIAASLDGKDKKSISHAFRCGYQLKHIFQDGSFSFPLPETDFIKGIKFGTVDYLKDDLDTKLNELISEVELLAANSNLPEKIDQKKLDGLILELYGMDL